MINKVPISTDTMIHYGGGIQKSSKAGGGDEMQKGCVWGRKTK